MFIEIGILIRDVETFNCSGATIWKLPACLSSVRIDKHTLVVRKKHNLIRIDSIVITTYLLFHYQVVLLISIYFPTFLQLYINQFHFSELCFWKWMCQSEILKFLFILLSSFENNPHTRVESETINTNQYIIYIYI